MSPKEAVIKLILKAFTDTPGDKYGISSEAKLSLNNVATTLLEPTIPPKALGLTYSTLNYWEKKGYLLIPAPKEADEWRRFSILEVLWIEILKDVAKMGCALEVVVPKLIFAYSNKYNHNEIIHYHREVTPHSVDTLHGVRYTPVLAFLTHIMGIFGQKSKATLHLFADSCQFAFEKAADKTAALKSAYEAMHRSGISVCISDILFAYLYGTEQIAPTVGGVFSNEEIQILAMLKQNKLKEITIKLEDGTPVGVHLKETFDIANEDNNNKRLKELLNSPYQEIRAVTNGGKTIAFERTTKHKLKFNVLKASDQ